MAESTLPRVQIDERLAALYDELDRFPAGVYCPWPLARVFNQLLSHAKREISDDPIVSAIRSLDEQDGDQTSGSSTALAGAVRGLISQVRVALASAPRAKPAATRAPAKAPKASR
jgi:hypothetical protein